MTSARKPKQQKEFAGRRSLRALCFGKGCSSLSFNALIRSAVVRVNDFRFDDAHRRLDRLAVRVNNCPANDSTCRCVGRAFDSARLTTDLDSGTTGRFSTSTSRRSDERLELLVSRARQSTTRQLRLVQPARQVRLPIERRDSLLSTRVTRQRQDDGRAKRPEWEESAATNEPMSLPVAVNQHRSVAKSIVLLIEGDRSHRHSERDTRLPDRRIGDVNVHVREATPSERRETGDGRRETGDGRREKTRER
jgi:hypothetical protein